MIATKGRLIALSSAALLLLSACSSPGASPTGAASVAPTEAAASAPASESAPAGSPASGIEVGYLPKDINNPYFRRPKSASTRASQSWVAHPWRPSAPDTDAPQVVVTDLTTKGVKAIVISADDPDAVAPRAQGAMDAGIKVVGTTPRRRRR
jgi:rhamnose transport system substrate-binding protein